MHELIMSHKKKVVGLIHRAFLDFEFSPCDKKKTKKKLVAQQNTAVIKQAALPMSLQFLPWYV